MQEAKLSVFSPAYWRTARAEFRNVRVLAFAGLVCAMAIVLEGLPIYLLGPSLKIYFSFLVVGLGCMCYGPCVGMMAGAIIDSVGFLLSSYGEPYFPGYLVTAVLSGFIYGVLLYKRKPTLLRIIVVRLIINYGSNVLLGSVWKAMLYGKGYLYYLTSGAIKNTLMLPVEVFFDVGGAQRRRQLRAGPQIHPQTLSSTPGPGTAAKQSKRSNCKQTAKGHTFLHR